MGEFLAGPALRRKSAAMLFDNGMNTPTHMAASTSDGQWTPSTSREAAISEIHSMASTMARFPQRGQSRATHKAAAVEKAAVLSV